MAALEFDVVLVQEDDGIYSVTVPALPGCTSQGETRIEAIAMIREAIELYIESLVAHGDRVPGAAEAEPRVEVERVTVAA
jgi:predicted RNase H-like HicB family nuclease